MTSSEFNGSIAEIGRLYHHYADFDLVVDSRLVNRPERTLFFALPGERRDGIAFLPSLIKRGVRHFVVRVVPEISIHGLTITVTSNPLDLLQHLAAYHRQTLSPRAVVAITGSNGKTIVKDWLSEMLGRYFKVCATPRSYNSQIGVPLAVWRMRAEDEIGIFEAGISQPGDMQRLAEIIQPTCGVLTNIGTAHLGNFTSVEQLFLEKMQLFAEVDWLLISQGVKQQFTVYNSILPDKLRVWFGMGPRGLSVAGTDYDLAFPELPDIYLENARSAAAAALQVGLSPDQVSRGIANLLPLTNRLEQREGRDGGIVINDSYSNDFSALAAAVDFAEARNPFDGLTLVLGKVQPLPDLQNRLATLLDGRVDRIILVGQEDYGLREITPALTRYTTTEELLEALPTLDFSAQTVIVKGASNQHFDRIADALSRQQHRTRLTVDLSALRHNLGVYREGLPPDCKLLVMTKASAYGSGALPVAQTLQEAGADYLAVAYPDEGHALRRGGIDLPILVLNSPEHALAAMAAAGLEPAIHTMRQFRLAERLNLIMHLEIDTGMGRLGFSTAEFIANLPELISPNVKSMFTHLAASEDPQYESFTHGQIASFDRLFARYVAGGGARVQRHLLNSNGMTRFGTASYEMVRLGIGLYGIGDHHLKTKLSPALTLEASVSTITEYEAGATIGYGRRGKIVRDGTRIAVVSIGYADGLPRAAGEGEYSLFVSGALAPTVGAICMDMCMVDVTDIPGAKIGDPVVVFGPEHPVEQLAEVCRTITYEILTGVGPRVHRVYRGE